MVPRAVLVSIAVIFLAFRHYGRCDRRFFTRTLLAGASLEEVAVVRNGESYGEGAANIPYPTDPTNLPALCAVTVRVRSSPTSSYRFGLFLPNEWNSRFLVVGNGVFAGGINWLDMAAGPRYGMASLSTDTGHNSSFTDSTWALNQPEKRTDWGWRAIHGSTILGKKLIRAYYSKRPLTYSYYSGCSTGGRQGLQELQRFPDSFDGALIGAPAWWTSHLNPYHIQISLYGLPVDDPKHLSRTSVSFLAEEVIRKCDGVDSVIDGIVSSPELCALNLSTLLCPDNTPDTSRCLTAPQISTAINLYSDYLSANDSSLLHPGMEVSSEAEWITSEPSPFGIGYARNFLFDDPTWDWHTFNESVITYAEKADPGNATADDYAALSEVRKRGGKVIMYHGLADGLVPPRGTQLYYNRTVAALSGGDVADFFRAFFVPGMMHCMGTTVNAPWNFAGASHAAFLGSGVWSVPGFEDVEHDAMMALMNWVERGKAVNRIIATTWRDPTDSTSGVRRQRPICPWPQKAVWDRLGDADVAGSWTCSW
ncbi:Tannase/feruloyl esterase [Chaetomium sp. MPI-CAGE-AT-0009]|nr:Tannase/feruloyl esterase [Chaetomium sp. MPI-CAGE-AT-0009]